MILVSFFYYCTKPFDATLDDFEDILVVDAFITSEIKQQEIKISRTFLDGEEVNQETGATVAVSDNTGALFIFNEAQPGTYVSEVPFGAITGLAYTLNIDLTSGTRLQAGPVEITSEGSLDELLVSKNISETGQEGISIAVDGTSGGSSTNFFRYDYVETFEVVSPFSANLDLVVVSEDPPVLGTIAKTKEERVCYRTQFSNEITLASSEGISNNRIQGFEIVFIPKNDFSIRNRYSILVNQYIQSPIANTFYQNLKDFSNLTTLFSQTQPGFIEGNITSLNNTNLRILGLFEVANVSSKRVFIDRADFFPNEREPDFIFECSLLSFPFNSSALLRLIQNGSHKYVSEDFIGFPPTTITVFTVVERGCVDCTSLGTNVVPDFWED